MTVKTDCDLLAEKWRSEKLAGDLRFAAGIENGVKFIRDRSKPGVTWRPRSMSPTGKVIEDYALGDVLDLSLHRNPEPRVSASGAAPAARVEPEVRQALVATGEGLTLGRTRSMEEVVAESTVRAKFNTVLLSIFGLIALIMAATGIYGLMAYSVEQRAREIGVRMAVGATSENVRNMVLREAAQLTAIGICLGLVAAQAVVRSITHLIFGVKTWDPAAFITVVALLFAAALGAAYFPARRATLVNPVDLVRRP